MTSCGKSISIDGAFLMLNVTYLILVSFRVSKCGLYMFLLKAGVTLQHCRVERDFVKEVRACV